MRRYWITKNQVSENGLSVLFEDEQFHHIFNVCRQIVGHQFEVITEESLAITVEVTEVAKKYATAKVISRRSIPPLPYPHLHLAMSIPRFPVLDAVCEKAVELGVKEIVPFVSEFSFIRKISEFSPSRFERLGKIVLSATQQSGRGELMSVHKLIDFQTMVKKIGPKDVAIFAYEGPTASRSLHTEIQSIKSKFSHVPENIWIFVGSEGGFSEKEAQILTDLGLHPVTLGRQILRVETACMALVSVLKYEFKLME